MNAAAAMRGLTFARHPPCHRLGLDVLWREHARCGRWSNRRGERERAAGEGIADGPHGEPREQRPEQER
jgi:hypothetical protein